MHAYQPERIAQIFTVLLREDLLAIPRSRSIDMWYAIAVNYDCTSGDILLPADAYHEYCDAPQWMRKRVNDNTIEALAFFAHGKTMRELVAEINNRWIDPAYQLIVAHEVRVKNGFMTLRIAA